MSRFCAGLSCNLHRPVNGTRRNESDEPDERGAAGRGGRNKQRDEGKAEGTDSESERHRVEGKGRKKEINERKHETVVKGRREGGEVRPGRS